MDAFLGDAPPGMPGELPPQQVSDNYDHPDHQFVEQQSKLQANAAVDAALQSLYERFGPVAAGGLLPLDLLQEEQHADPCPSHGVDPRVLAYLTILDEYRVACEGEGKYTEAGVALRQVAAIREREAERCAAALAERHTKERALLLVGQQDQFARFQASWEDFMGRYDNASAKYLADMQQRQAVALKAAQDSTADEVMMRQFRGTRELKDWRERAESLARQRKYADAARVRNVAEELERRERAAFDNDRLTSFGLREKAFLQTQDAELQALSKKVHLRRQEHATQCAVDTQRLAQRDKNAVSMLESRQATDSLRAASTVRITLATTRAKRQYGMGGGASHVAVSADPVPTLASAVTTIRRIDDRDTLRPALMGASSFSSPSSSTGNSSSSYATSNSVVRGGERSPASAIAHAAHYTGLSTTGTRPDGTFAGTGTATLAGFRSTGTQLSTSTYIPKPLPLSTSAKAEAARIATSPNTRPLPHEKHRPAAFTELLETVAAAESMLMQSAADGTRGSSNSGSQQYGYGGSSTTAIKISTAPPPPPPAAAAAAGARLYGARRPIIQGKPVSALSLVAAQQQRMGDRQQQQAFR